MSDRANALRIWLLPFSVLAGTATGLLGLGVLLDVAVGADLSRVAGLLATPDPASAAQTIANSGEVLAAVLGIAITVVAIVVELASNRYTHRVTELFIAEPINFGVMGLFVVSAIQSLWVSLIFDLDVDELGHVLPSSYVPTFGIAIAMGLITICLLVLLPYFAFVFHFLNPHTIVERIRKQVLRDIARKPSTHAKQQALRGIEQLADVAMNAMENKDTGISMASLEALANLTVDYRNIKEGLPPEWFEVDEALAKNADFVSMDESVLAAVSARRIWLEMKVLRQFQTLYNEALNKTRDINYAVAIHTRRLGELALAASDEELLALSVKFFNTYLRATINARDVRTAYNVLNQYRLLAEAVLHHAGGASAVEIAGYFRYYGRLSFDQKQPFVLETVAYDLGKLCEIAFDEKSPALDELLQVMLSIDKESEGDVQELSLRGVRKAQVKLATYFLVCGAEHYARIVFLDLAHEKPERLTSIRDELLAVTTGEFWEVSDRGQNFDYLTPDRKNKLRSFFGWFGATLPPPPMDSMRPSLGGAPQSIAPSGVGESN